MRNGLPSKSLTTTIGRIETLNLRTISFGGPCQRPSSPNPNENVRRPHLGMTFFGSDTSDDAALGCSFNGTLTQEKMESQVYSSSKYATIRTAKQLRMEIEVVLQQTGPALPLNRNVILQTSRTKSNP